MAINTSRFDGPVYALLRFVAGGMFCCHGMQAVLGWLTSSATAKVGSQAWVGGMIELVGGVLIALGLFTRLAAFIAAGTMAVAYFQFHWKLALHGWKWLPIVNKGELAVLYCFVFLFIAAHGPGMASLDRRFRRG